jgi:hypothetical protein
MSVYSGPPTETDRQTDIIYAAAKVPVVIIERMKVYSVRLYLRNYPAFSPLFIISSKISGILSALHNFFETIRHSLRSS